MGALRVYLVAGEASGDRLGAALMRGLKAEAADKIEFFGVGGPLMAAEGQASLFDMSELAIFGLLEVLPKYRHLVRRLNQTAENFISSAADVLITIDSPGFNLRLAAKVRAGFSGKIIHYVAPSVWAWKPGRAKKMAQHVDHVLALLPFEPPYMEAAGMSCDFVGHPVATEPVPDAAQIAALRQQMGIGAQSLITLLPGSRLSEITRLAPIFFEVAKRLGPAYHFALPVAGEHLKEPLEQMLAQAGLRAELVFPENGQKTTVFAASELALAASGTVSIELAAVGTPMVIGYKTNWLTAAIMRKAMLAPSFTLVNLLTESKAVPEFEPRLCTVENLLGAMKTLLEDPLARATQIAAGERAIMALGRGGPDPARRAARSVLSQQAQPITNRD
ncbi:MAG: lipid-A-disaccharide synthase [Rhodobacteraceae bacterium]|nr:lipid-A-disaccharide synthase [Paracoccaceae bacterium]